MKIQTKNLLPASNKLTGIWKGVIEDNKDPEKRGRCRIRVFGLHTHVKEIRDTIGISTENLPWAEPVLSTFEGSISSFGVFNIPVQGSHVYLFFDDGNILAPRFFGSISGTFKIKPNVNYGFSDPSGKYPLDTSINVPDFHKLARDETSGTIVETKKTNKTTNVPTAKNLTWSEPDPYYYESTSKYPDNTVIATHGGHVFEIDNKESYARFSYYHPSNTYIEISKDGNVILSNKKDRYDITVGDERKVVKGCRDLTILKGSTKYVNGGEKITVLEGRDTLITDHEKMKVASTLEYYIKGQTDITSTGIQNIKAQGNQFISSWGNFSLDTKGFGSTNFLGYRNNSITGYSADSVKGWAVDNSVAPKKVGSNSTLTLGRGPFTTANNMLNSGLSGINASIASGLKPIYDTVNTIQSTVAKTINDITSYVNAITQPITDIMNAANTAVTFVKNEIAAAQQLVLTAQNLPDSMRTMVSNYATSIVNIPGYAMSNIVNQIVAAPNQLNAFRSFTSLYMNTNDLLGKIGQPTNTNILTDYYNIMGSISTYATSFLPLGSFSAYPRSGLNAYTNGTYKTTTYKNYYIKNVSPSAQMSFGTALSNEGNFQDELNEMELFINDALCASYITSAGIVDFDMLIDRAFQDYSMYEYAESAISISNMMYGEGAIDQEAMLAVGGIVSPALSADNYLTPNQFNATITYLEALSLISQEGRDILWPYLNDTRSIGELQSTVPACSAVYNYLRVSGESDYDFETRMWTTTPLELLDSTISYEISLELATTKTNLLEYTTAVSVSLSGDFKELFSSLLGWEEEIKEMARSLLIENYDWGTKYDDFPGELEL